MRTLRVAGAGKELVCAGVRLLPRRIGEGDGQSPHPDPLLRTLSAYAVLAAAPARYYAISIGVTAPRCRRMSRGSQRRSLGAGHSMPPRFGCQREKGRAGRSHPFDATARLSDSAIAAVLAPDAGDEPG